MFSTSTQCKLWTFGSEKNIAALQMEANRQFVVKHSEEGGKRHFLSHLEERILCKQYEYVLRDFCKKFQPPMPRTVTGTAFHYFKRFYLHNSVMNYHPKQIVVTCVYLACKVEEFNVSISQFVANVKGDREKATEIILNNELLLMEQLNYNLTVHNPFRPLEGILIDIKTRFQNMEDPEKLRPAVDDFFEKIFFTDACLIYAPSQIAVAAILYATNKLQLNFESYITDVLFAHSSREMLNNLKEALKKINIMLRNIEPPQRDQCKIIEKRLEKCRNQENNPDSVIYKRKLQEMLEEEEMESVKKYSRISEEQRKVEEELLGVSSLPD